MGILTQTVLLTTLVLETIRTLSLTKIESGDAAPRITINCGTGSGVTIARWIKVVDNSSFKFYVQEGTYTGLNQNGYIQSNPDRTSSFTKGIPKGVWTWLAMHFDNTCKATKFYRLNNLVLDTLPDNEKNNKFDEIAVISDTVTGTYNLQNGISKINSNKHLTTLYYGMGDYLEYGTETYTTIDEAAFELAYGHVKNLIHQTVWKVNQDKDIEDETVYDYYMRNSTTNFTVIERGNLNAFGAKVGVKEVFRL